jgi:hypothetical protein
LQGSYVIQGSSSTEKLVEKSNIQFTKGANVLCVPSPGSYKLKASGCHVFDEDTKVVQTSSSDPIYINAVKHKNGIRILSEIEKSFEIDAEFENGSKQVLKPSKHSEKVDGYVAYSIDINMKSGERVKLVPKSEQMLFKPDQTEWRGASDCVDVAFNFIATKGLVVTGRTQPAINDVTVSLLFPKNPELSTITTRTNGAGEFKFPTIDPTLDYELKAEKESYVFQEFDSGKNVFYGNKLSEILVHVKDDTGNELSSVVISLSGEENYRKNIATDAAGAKFHSLKPGKYFLRAMMKEYDFKPNSQTLDVKDGETLNINLR